VFDPLVNWFYRVAAERRNDDSTVAEGELMEASLDSFQWQKCAAARAPALERYQTNST
jgi:hypothetical protein